MSCTTCAIELVVQQWSGCICPVWNCCADAREVKTKVEVLALPANPATAKDFAPGTVLATDDGEVTWIAPTGDGHKAYGVVVCAPIHKVGQTYPAQMEIVIRTANSGVYDKHLLWPAAFVAADISKTLTAMQSAGFDRRVAYP